MISFGIILDHLGSFEINWVVVKFLESLWTVWAHLESSKLIRGHLGTPEIVWNHLRASGIISDPLGSPGVIWAHPGSHGIIRDHLIPSEISWDHLESPVLIWNHLGCSRNIWNHSRLYEIMWNELGDRWESPWGPWEVSGKLPAKTVEALAALDWPRAHEKSLK